MTKLPNLNEKTRWLHLETAAPQCTLAEQVGSKYDLIRYNRATILCETNGKHDWIQNGEMLMARTACWRLIDSPSVGEGGGSQEAASTDPVLQGSLDKLRDLDSHSPSNGSSKEIIEYNLARANLLEQIVQKVKPDEREQWVRQIADCLAPPHKTAAMPTRAPTSGWPAWKNS